MICKNCGIEVPDGAKFCFHCGGAVSSEPAGVDVNAAFDPDATVIAGSVDAPATPAAPIYQQPPVAPVYQPPSVPVTPAEPASPVYQRPMDPVSPAYQVPSEPVAPVNPHTPASPKKPLNVKLIAVIGAVVAVVVAIVLLAVFLNKDKPDDPGTDSSSAVSSAVKEYIEDFFGDDYDVSGYKSKYKVSADGAYYQIVTATVKEGEEKGYLAAEIIVCEGSIEEFDYGIYSEDEKSDFNSDVNDVVNECKENEDKVKEKLAEVAAYYNGDEYYYDYY